MCPLRHARLLVAAKTSFVESLFKRIRLRWPRGVQLDLLRVFRTLAAMPVSPPAILDTDLQVPPLARSMKPSKIPSLPAIRM